MVDFPLSSSFLRGVNVCFPYFFKETKCWRWCPKIFPKIFSNRWWKNTGKVVFFPSKIDLNIVKWFFFSFPWKSKSTIELYTIFLGNLNHPKLGTAMILIVGLTSRVLNLCFFFLCFFLHFPTWKPESHSFFKSLIGWVQSVTWKMAGNHHFHPFKTGCLAYLEVQGT